MKRTWLINMRNKRNLTHQDVANKVNISRQYYGMIENRERDPSVESAETAKKIAKLFKFNWTLALHKRS